LLALDFEEEVHDIEDGKKKGTDAPRELPERSTVLLTPHL
jgi:hypothetical protein